MIKEGFETTTCSCGNITFYEYYRFECFGCDYLKNSECHLLDFHPIVSDRKGCILQECTSCGKIEQEINSKFL